MPIHSENQSRPLRGGMLIAAIAVVVLVAAFLGPRLVRPRLYYAAVTMEVKPDGPRAAAPGLDPQFLQTQMEVLRKREILDPVIEQLNLTAVYSRGNTPLTKEEARVELMQALKMQNVRNTGLIEAGIYDRNPNVAADIANTLALVYRNARLANAQQLLEQGLAQFVDYVSKQCKVVEELSASRKRSQESVAINDPSPDDPNAPLAEANPGKEVAAYQEAKARHLQAQKVLEAAELRLSEARMKATIDTEPVKIWERAVPPPRPVSPSGR
jgi:uncharacterized protein involved in exopolysaccharide biosynthesis